MSLGASPNPRMYGPDERVELLTEVSRQMADQWSTPTTDAADPDAPLEPDVADPPADPAPNEGGSEHPPADPPSHTPAQEEVVPTPSAGPVEFDPSTIPGQDPSSPPFDTSGSIDTGGAPTPATETGGVESGSAPQTPPPAPIADVPPAPPSFSDPAATVDTNAIFQDFLGRPAQQGEIVELLNFVGGVQHLPPQHQQAIADMLAGKDPFAVTGGQQTTRAAPPQAAPVAPPSYPTEPAPWDDAPSAPPAVDPRLDAVIAQQQAITNQLAAQQQAQAQELMRAGAQDFAANSPLKMSPEEFAILEHKTAQSGVFALNARTMDPRSAWRTSLEQTLWSDPTYRNRVIAAQAAPPPADIAARQQAASAISPVNSAPPPSPVSATTSPADAKAAALKAAADMMAQGTQRG